MLDFDAKFNVLAENVLHHIKEEESEMLPKAQDMDLDFVKLGQRMLRRKEELLVSGLPTVAVHPKRKKAAKASKRGRA